MVASVRWTFRKREVDASEAFLVPVARHRASRTRSAAPVLWGPLVRRRADRVGIAPSRPSSRDVASVRRQVGGLAFRAYAVGRRRCDGIRSCHRSAFTEDSHIRAEHAPIMRGCSLSGVHGSLLLFARRVLVGATGPRSYPKSQICGASGNNTSLLLFESGMISARAFFGRVIRRHGEAGMSLSATADLKIVATHR